MAKKAGKVGRPPKAPEERYVNPVRYVGRVSDADWAPIEKAAELAGCKTVGAWAVPILLAAAKRELRKHKAKE